MRYTHTCIKKSAHIYTSVCIEMLYIYLHRGKVKQFRYRPGVAQRVPDFMTTAQDGGKVVSLTHRQPLPPGNSPGNHFC